jgi:LacI family transcriptional regulator
MGYAAASLLDRMLAGETLRVEDRLIRLPPLGVVKRMSTDILAVNDPYVADALQFIRAHACDPCTVPDVLDHVPVNRRWLERQFMQKLARSPHDEIIRVRMQAAKRLLLQLELTLPDVAYRCGFTAVSTFGQTFRKVFGITPGDFRRTSLRFKK